MISTLIPFTSNIVFMKTSPKCLSSLKSRLTLTCKTAFYSWNQVLVLLENYRNKVNFLLADESILLFNQYQCFQSQDGLTHYTFMTSILVQWQHLKKNDNGILAKILINCDCFPKAKSNRLLRSCWPLIFFFLKKLMEYFNLIRMLISIATEFEKIDNGYEYFW